MPAQTPRHQLRPIAHVGRRETNLAVRRGHCARGTAHGAAQSLSRRYRLSGRKSPVQTHHPLAKRQHSESNDASLYPLHVRGGWPRQGGQMCHPWGAEHPRRCRLAPPIVSLHRGPMRGTSRAHPTPPYAQVYRPTRSRRGPSHRRLPSRKARYQPGSWRGPRPRQCSVPRR